jgi:hypothetical protein
MQLRVAHVTERLSRKGLIARNVLDRNIALLHEDWLVMVVVVSVNHTVGIGSNSLSVPPIIAEVVAK